MAQIEFRLFGKLGALASARGIAAPYTAEVPTEGRNAGGILLELGLPLDDAEGVFVNHRMHPLTHVIMPGDRVAFVPRGVPGPHRYTLGIYSAGRGEESK